MAQWTHEDLRAWLAPVPGRRRMRLGLTHVRQMLARLSNPQDAFPSVHVAGTNGKGSLCAHLAARAAASGNLVGLFTSPHLVNVEERARIDGRPIDEKEFDECLDLVRKASEETPPIEVTYYEKTFLVALLSFKRAGVDRAIIETGLGGRLDATRCVNADFCAITTISEDHLDILGPTLFDVAREKAGIYRPDVPLMMFDPDDEEIESQVRRLAGRDFLLHTDKSTDEPWEKWYKMASKIGDHMGWEKDPMNTRWPGRDGILHTLGNVTVRLSAAHNLEGISDEASRLDRDAVIMIGFTQKENLDAILAPLMDDEASRRIIHAVITEPEHGRLPPHSAQKIGDIFGSVINHSFSNDVLSAFEEAFQRASDQDTELLVMGSIHLIGDVLSVLNPLKHDLSDVLLVHPPRQPS